MWMGMGGHEGPLTGRVVQQDTPPFKAGAWIICTPPKFMCGARASNPLPAPRQSIKSPPHPRVLGRPPPPFRNVLGDPSSPSSQHRPPPRITTPLFLGVGQPPSPFQKRSSGLCHRFGTLWPDVVAWEGRGKREQAQQRKTWAATRMGKDKTKNLRCLKICCKQYSFGGTPHPSCWPDTHGRRALRK